jgi:hypothetical protein
MIENANTDISSLSSIHAGKKDNNIICERITEVKEPSSLIKAISEVLKDTCEQSQLNKNEKLILIKPFMTKKRLNFSIYEYLNHLYKYSQASEEIFIIMLIYIDRLKTNRKICLNYFNIYKLILAAFVVAIKFNYDEVFSLDFYSKLGGVSQKELASLEYDFTTLLNFKFYVEEKIFTKYNNFLRTIDSDDEDCDYESDG